MTMSNKTRLDKLVGDYNLPIRAYFMILRTVVYMLDMVELGGAVEVSNYAFTERHYALAAELVEVVGKYQKGD